ncbi:MAG TPA: RNA polymerase subunit sigma-24, partial [Solirubrobacterales bacterium]
RTQRGRSRVARIVMGWLNPDTRLPGIEMRPVEVNGGPGALFFDPDRRLVGVTALDIVDGEIKAISSVANPDKLRHLGAPVGNLATVIAAKR